MDDEAAILELTNIVDSRLAPVGSVLGGGMPLGVGQNQPGSAAHFEYEDGALHSDDWKSVSDPAAKSAIAAALSSSTSSEETSFWIGGQRYQIECAPDGALWQLNQYTGKRRRLRVAGQAASSSKSTSGKLTALPSYKFALSPLASMTNIGDASFSGNAGDRSEVLSPSSPEYREVESYFSERLSAQQRSKVSIDEIERLVHRDMRDQYNLVVEQYRRREAMRRSEGRAYEASVEMVWMFHGTSQATAEKIRVDGFNRSYAGKNATFYGLGSYFVLDSSYSASDNYSTPDADGHKRILLCRVAVGAAKSVASGYVEKEPPVRDEGRKLRFDTTTSDDGKIVVAYKDAQAYPEYLVTFRFVTAPSASLYPSPRV